MHEGGANYKLSRQEIMQNCVRGVVSITSDT